MASQTGAASHVLLGHAALVDGYCSLVWYLVCYFNWHSCFGDLLSIPRMVLVIPSPHRMLRMDAYRAELA